MLILDKLNSVLSIEMSVKEFNLIREMLPAILMSCSEHEIPTLTGWTKKELLELMDHLTELAEKNNINL